MRVISGEFGGRRFKGKIPNGIRPTADSTKETIFNILNNEIEIYDAQIADLCAGAGSLGIEALSRGGEHCFFVDKARKSTMLISSICEDFKIDKSSYSIVTKDSIAFLKSIKEQKSDFKFDLVFTDPPYALKLVNKIMQSLEELELIDTGSFFVAEHSNMEVVKASEKWELVVQKKFGETIVDIFEFVG